MSSVRAKGVCVITCDPGSLQDSNPRPFRYDVKRNPKINAFTPKQLQTQEGEHMACRATQFGAIDFTDHTKVPKSKQCGIVWEAQQVSPLKLVTACCFGLLCLWCCRQDYWLLEVELTSGGNELRPSKPKFWLTCRVDVPAESAVRLS